MKVEYEVRITDKDKLRFDTDGQARAYAARVVDERPELDFVIILAWVGDKPGQRWIVRRACKWCGRLIGSGKCNECEACTRESG
jgi:hypothetical protein